MRFSRRLSEVRVIRNVSVEERDEIKETLKHLQKKKRKTSFGEDYILEIIFIGDWQKLPQAHICVPFELYSLPYGSTSLCIDHMCFLSCFVAIFPCNKSGQNIHAYVNLVISSIHEYLHRFWRLVAVFMYSDRVMSRQAPDQIRCTFVVRSRKQTSKNTTKSEADNGTTLYDRITQNCDFL